nr:hypothetical protein [Liquorilactobacillus satsumensis]
MQFKASQRIAQVGQKYLAIQQKQIRSLEKQGMKVINLGAWKPRSAHFSANCCEGQKRTGTAAKLRVSTLWR